MEVPSWKPYCLFLFFSHLAADIVFLCSWQIQTGGTTLFHVLAAASFALPEWYRPIRGRKIESGLWRHPHKYAVPAMLLLAGLVSLF